MSRHALLHSKMARRKSKWDIPADAVADSNGGSPNSAAEAARERAAKLTAMLAAKGKLAKNTGSVLPVVRSTIVLTPQPLPKVEKDQDLITAEVEINDSSSRIILCKGTTQDEISRYSGAAVSTKGRYMDAEEKKLEIEGLRPLYLCVQGTSQNKVDIAVRRIQEIMSGSDIYGKHPLVQTSSQTRWSPYQPPPPVINTSFPAPLPLTQAVATQAMPTGMHYVQDKVFVGLDSTCSSDFNVKEKLLGPVGCYFQHITTETGAKVFLRGKGSGFLEPTSGKEAFEALHIYISHAKLDGLSAARKLVENLIQTVNSEYQNFEQMKRVQQPGHPPQSGYPQPIPGYMPPMGYPSRPGIPLPPGTYPQPPGPTGPPPGMYYGHPLPGHPQPPPPPPAHGQMMPPHGYGAPAQGPPLSRGHANGTTYPGYSIHQGATPPGVPYPPRPSVHPEVVNRPEFQGPPTSAPNLPLPQQKETQDHNNRQRQRPQEVVRPEPQPEPAKRRFKEVLRNEPPQEPQPRNTQECPRIPEPSSLGNTLDTRTSQMNYLREGNMMPPPMIPRGLMQPPKTQPRSTTVASNTKEFKKPLGLAKPFVVPPPPKDIIKHESTSEELVELPGTIRKHGLPMTLDTSASKKVKKEEEGDGEVPPLSPTMCIMSLVAYDEDSSEEEEDDYIPNHSTYQINNRSTSQNLPFWAVGKK